MSEAQTPELAEDGDPARLVGPPDVVFRLFEAAPVMLMGLSRPPECRITAVNAATRATAGRANLVGRPYLEGFADVADQRLQDLVLEAYTTRAPVVRRDLRIQLEPVPGQRIEMFVDFILAPTYAPDGTVDGVAVASFDVTASVLERRAASREAGEARQRYRHARDVIDTLQRELLPAGVPVLPGVQIAASYLPAKTDAAAGGDWFDALVVPDGRLALIVGDVVGHGVTASATMGQLRIVLRERLAGGGGLLEAVAAVDRAARSIPAARAATVCVALLDPDTGELEYCTAGHPAPLLLGAETSYLPGTGSGPLGVGSRFASATGRLAAEEMLLLYTDGAIERPGRGLSAATVEFAQIAADVAAGRVFRTPALPVERVATQTLELLTRATGHMDDITLLAAQRVPAVLDLSVTIPSDHASLADLRRETSRWAADAGLSEADTGRLQHAIGELVTNSIEHAHPDSAEPATVTVTVAVTPDGHLRAQVADDGRWREPRPNVDRGLGLTMVAGLVDTLEIDRGEHGTTATLTHPLTRLARLLTGRELPQPALTGATDPEIFLVLDQPSAPGVRMRVDGPIDNRTARALERQLQQATAAGTRSLTLDLVGVTHLASAGVAVLHRLTRLAADQHSELQLYAPVGSPADAILALVQLPYTTVDPDY